MLASFHTVCIMNILLTHFFYTPNSKMAAYPVKLGLVASKHGIEGRLMIFTVLLNAVRRFRKCFKTAVYQNVEKKVMWKVDTRLHISSFQKNKMFNKWIVAI